MAALPKIAQFIIITVFLMGCFAIGLFGYFLTPRFVAFRMERLKARKLEKIVPFLSFLLRTCFVLLAVLSFYVLTKMPAVYRCAFHVK